MKADETKAEQWFKEMTVCFPGINKIFGQAASEILVIGASVFSLYEAQDWIPPLKRRTADLDLSVKLISGVKDYEGIKHDLLKQKYTQRPKDPIYRFFSPLKVVGQPSYIDLLAHPGSAKVSKAEAIQLMGVGSGFSFEGLNFAEKEPYRVIRNMFYPNPLGFFALKRASYRDDPINRIKDLADIIELAYGLVQKGQHFEVSDLWKKLKPEAEAGHVRKMLEQLGGSQSPEWDIDEARHELLSRGFNNDEIDETIPASTIEFARSLS